jgi:zinc/manganese transport system ATP-binding protein
VMAVRGRVEVGGSPARGRPGVRTGYVPQLETIDWQFPITVAQVVQLGVAAESGPWPWPSRDVRRRVVDMLDRVGIGDLAARPIRALSGGQQQRVFLARALIRRPDLLVLDEPTVGLDVVTRREILDLLRDLHADGTAIVMSTHDLNAVAAELPDLVCVNRRVLARGTPDEVFTPEILAATFGAELVVFTHDGRLLTADAGPQAAP